MHCANLQHTSIQWHHLPLQIPPPPSSALPPQKVAEKHARARKWEGKVREVEEVVGGLNATLNKSPERGHRASLSLDRAYACSLLAYVLPHWLLDFDTPHHRGPVWSLFILAHLHTRAKTPPPLSALLLPFISIDLMRNYRRGRRFGHCECEMSRETSLGVPVPCAPDVDYFEDFYAGGVSSDGAFEVGYQDGFEEVLRLSLSESV